MIVKTCRNVVFPIEIFYFVTQSVLMVRVSSLGPTTRMKDNGWTIRTNEWQPIGKKSQKTTDRPSEQLSGNP